jgi:glycogen debranching enzyme
LSTPDHAAMKNIASKAKSKAKHALGNVQMPARTKGAGEPITPTSSGSEPATPKTPADEGIQFFESAVADKSKPIAVYEIHLDADGGPNKERAVRAPIDLISVSIHVC